MLGAWAEGDWTPGRGLERTGIKPVNQHPPTAVLSAKEGKFHPPAHGQAEEAWLPHGI